MAAVKENTSGQREMILKQQNLIRVHMLVVSVVLTTMDALLKTVM